MDVKVPVHPPFSCSKSAHIGCMCGPKNLCSLLACLASGVMPFKHFLQYQQTQNTLYLILMMCQDEFNINYESQAKHTRAKADLKEHDVPNVTFMGSNKVKLTRDLDVH